MRRKLTEPDLSSDDLPDITDQQRDFVHGILQGKTLSDAYRSAYDCSNSAASTIWACASRLAADVKVAAWLGAARKAEFGRACRTKEQHILRLDRLQQIAIETGNVGAAVQAEQLVGKVEGHYVEQYRDLTRDPIDSLREIAAHSPALAAQLAKESGIQWDEQPTAH